MMNSCVHSEDSSDEDTLDGNTVITSVPDNDLLTVFQASPLANDATLERQTLEEALEDALTKVEIAFEPATPDRLGSFLARGEGHAMHLSCQGNSRYIAQDEEYGVLHRVFVNLPHWIQAGGRSLHFVFVAACFSRAAGEAFVEAGVPHVLCCQDDSELDDKSAIEFTRSFYEALAWGNLLEDAFDIARQQVMITAAVSFEDRHEAMQKFVLLPEDANHRVPVFMKSLRPRLPRYSSIHLEDSFQEDTLDENPVITSDSDRLTVLSRHSSAHFEDISQEDALDDNTVTTSETCNDLLTVFQSSPLEGVNKGSQVSPLDATQVLAWERNILKQALKDGRTKVEIAFEPATIDRLFNFLARGEGRVMHLSCHGNAPCFALDNGHGEIHKVLLKDLQNWIKAGGWTLHFVFVSACMPRAARKAGENFVRAGVPHVVCCQDDSKLNDESAVEFASAFYKALARGNLLEDAFEFARQQVMISNVDSFEDRHEAMQKFVLLPEEANHLVPVFTKTSRPRLPRQRPLSQSRMVPLPPNVFEGRKLEKFKAVEALKNPCLLRVTGPPGIGKLSLVKAVCVDRRQMSPEEDLLWVPALHAEDGDVLFVNLMHIYNIYNLLKDDAVSADLRENNCYKFCLHRLINALQDRASAMIVINTKDLPLANAKKKLCLFLEDLVQGATNVRVIVIHNSKDDLPVRKCPCREIDIVLSPLELGPTVTVFAKLCPHVWENSCPTIGEAGQLYNLLLPPREDGVCCSNGRSKRSLIIFKMLGEGNPERIRQIAKTMTAEEYDKLIGLGRGCDDDSEEGTIDDNTVITSETYNDLLTVFQASPLAYDATPHLALERQILEDALEDALTKVEIAFEPATKDRLESFLARGEGHAMHLSCRGNSPCFALDNGHGEIHQVLVQDLQNWIQAGGRNLHFVFVSACLLHEAREAGEAFVRASVPHVVCCQDDSELNRTSAIEFTRCFYEALAWGNLLEDAFDIARRQVMITTVVSFEDRHEAMQKFVLLPEDANHRVPVFSKSLRPRLPRHSSVHFGDNYQEDTLDDHTVITSNSDLLAVSPRHSSAHFEDISQEDSLDDNTVITSETYNDLLTVFQASPLAYVQQGNNQISLIDATLDLALERQILEQALKDACTKVEIAFEPATPHRLGSFLARDEGHVMHLSCHGRPEYLVLDNGFGAMHELPVGKLRDWIQAGRRNLHFVFVSACYSRNAGEALVRAGVPHVVCCDSKLDDHSTIQFTGSFYHALACGNLLDDAFELARQQVMVSTNRHEEMQELVLLPEDTNHRVPVFTKSLRPRLPSQRPLSQLRFIPPPPNVFKGRNLDMYNVLEALKDKCLLRITGPPGIGKLSLVKAVCNYRRLMSPGEDLLWVPTLHTDDEDVLCVNLMHIYNLLKDDAVSPDLRDNGSYKFCLHRLIIALQDRTSAVVVINTKDLPLENAKAKLCLFLEDLIQDATYVRVIVIHNSKDDLPVRKCPCRETDFVLTPLDLKSTVALFAALCPHVREKRCLTIGEAGQLYNLLVLREDGVCCSNARSKRSLMIFKMLGEGNPERIRQIAKTMTAEEYDKLIRIGRGCDDDSEEGTIDDNTVVTIKAHNKEETVVRSVH